MNGAEFIAMAWLQSSKPHSLGTCECLISHSLLPNLINIQPNMFNLKSKVFTSHNIFWQVWKFNLTSVKLRGRMIIIRMNELIRGRLKMLAGSNLRKINELIKQSSFLLEILTMTVIWIHLDATTQLFYGTKGKPYHRNATCSMFIRLDESIVLKIIS